MNLLFLTKMIASKTTAHCLISLIIFAFFFNSCHLKTKETTKNQEPIRIDFASNFRNFKEIKLSQIADSIEYVKLENLPKCFAMHVESVQISDSFIFVVQRSSILQFDRKGKFIQQIGQQGRGPGEYAKIYDLCINRNEKKLYINAGSTKKIQIYDFKGRYLSGYKYFSNINFEMLDSIKIVSSIENFKGQEPFQLIITNPNKDTLSILANNVTFPLRKAIYNLHSPFKKRFYRWNHTLHFVPTYDDTVYQIKALNQIVPLYVIDKGKYKLPVKYRLEYLQDFNEFYSKADKYIQTFVHEIKDYVMINYINATYSGKTNISVYDKRSKEVFSVGNPNRERKGFTNDLDGYGNYIPQSVQDNQYLISYYPAFKLFEKNKERVKQIKNSDVQNDLNPHYLQFMQSVKENDNLIVQIIHLKKD